MPSLAKSLPPSSTSAAAPLPRVEVCPSPFQGPAHFHVVPFRRDASGAIVPGTAIEVTNGDLAWRYARAAAAEHDNVGAVELKDGAPLASFGEVNLDALRH